MKLPQELIDSLNTGDDVENALQMGGEIIEFSTQTTETTAVLVPRSNTPILPPLSRMTLCQPDVPIPSAAISNQVDRDQQPQPCSSYTPELVHEYTEVEVPSSPLSSTDELDEAILSELQPVLVQDKDSYDLEVRPLIRTDITPFVNPNDRLLLPDVQNSDLTGMLELIVDCMIRLSHLLNVPTAQMTSTSKSKIIVSVESYGDRNVQYFCSRDHCANELQRQSNRKGAFHGLNHGALGVSLGIPPEYTPSGSFVIIIALLFITINLLCYKNYCT